MANGTWEVGETGLIPEGFAYWDLSDERSIGVHRRAGRKGLLVTIASFHAPCHGLTCVGLDQHGRRVEFNASVLLQTTLCGRATHC